MPTTEEIAYSAGLFDGEGSVSLATRSAKRTEDGLPYKSPALYLQLSSTDTELIKWLKDTWQMGSVFIGYRPSRPNHRTAHTWRLSRTDAETFLNAVLPYLRTKRQQALLAIEYRSLVGVAGRKTGTDAMKLRLEYRDKMIALNGRIMPNVNKF